MSEGGETCIFCGQTFVSPQDESDDFTCMFHPLQPLADARFPAEAFRDGQSVGVHPCCGRHVNVGRDSRSGDGCVRGYHSTGKATLFISYSRGDRETVEEIASKLRFIGQDVWLDRQDIRVGEKWEQSISEIIRRCRAVIVFHSEKAARSIWVRQELKIANDFAKPVYCLELDDTPNALPYRAETWKLGSKGSRPDYGDAAYGEQRYFVDVAAAIEARLSHTKA